jgi:hypothetical protein
MTRVAAALLVAGLAGPAGAQTPGDFATQDTLHQLQVCRAAVFYQLDDKARGVSKLPVPLARALGEQIEFVMQEGILNKTPASLDDGTAITRFAESWFIGFSQVLHDERTHLLDPVQRDKILLDCIPFVWVAERGLIDYLMQWRVHAIGAPPLPNPDEDRKRQAEVFKRLMR